MKSKYFVKDLFDDGDFPNQLSADEFYGSHEITPEIVCLLKEPELKEVKTISIEFHNNKTLKIAEVKYKPFELLLPSFWQSIGIERRFKKFPYTQCLDSFFERNVRNDAPRDLYFYKYIYIDLPIISNFGNIWNEACLLEGKTNISRDDFCLWLYRLTSIIYDLIEYPFLNDRFWKRRLKLIKTFVEDKFGKECEYYNKTNWFENGFKTISKLKATNNRLQDAKTLLNDFFSIIKPTSALEVFLIAIYESFAQEMQKRHLLGKCNYCNRYIILGKEKKYCSLLKDGSDCGKKARNKIFYTKNRKKLLPKARKATKSLRKYYKQRGIVK